MSAIIARTEPPIGHIHLLLKDATQTASQLENEFFLEIPISFIERHYRSPLKFLRFLGWCILGSYGRLLDHQFREVPLDGQLIDRSTYYYQPELQGDVFKHAVDLEVIRAKTLSGTSESTTRSPIFRENLLQRDGRCCVFTGGSIGVEAIHIIPHRKGDEWVKLIVSNRPSDEPVIDLHSIDDPRNGLTCGHSIHDQFDKRLALILKTPNVILTENDVVPRFKPADLPTEGSDYPSDERYTLQLLHVPEMSVDRAGLPDNGDATFLTSSTLPKPSALLLNYNFGAAAVKNWGQNTSIFSKRPGILRPKVETPAMNPTRTSGPANRERSAKKRKLRESETDGQEEAGPSHSTAEEMQDSEQDWDEDDVMLYFWGNSRAAKERREREEQDREEYINSWTSSVLVGE